MTDSNIADDETFDSQEKPTIHRILTRAGISHAQAWLVMRMYGINTLNDLAFNAKDIGLSPHLIHVMGEEEVEVMGRKLVAILESEGIKIPGRLRRWWRKALINIGNWSPPPRW